MVRLIYVGKPRTCFIFLAVNNGSSLIQPTTLGQFSKYSFWYIRSSVDFIFFRRLFLNFLACCCLHWLPSTHGHCCHSEGLPLSSLSALCHPLAPVAPSVLIEHVLQELSGKECMGYLLFWDQYCLRFSIFNFELIVWQSVEFWMESLKAF